MTVGVAVLMAFPILRLLYMDQQFENYLAKIKAARDRAHEDDSKEILDKCKQMWDKLLLVSEKNRSSIKYDFAAVLAVLIIGLLTMFEFTENPMPHWIRSSIYLILGVSIGTLLKTFMCAFSQLNKTKRDVNMLIFEI